MSRYQRLLVELAAPRLVGSSDHARVRAVLQRELAARGYVVLEHQFAMRRPGGLGPPLIAGGALAWLALASVLLRTLPAHPGAVAVGLALAFVPLTFVIVASRRGEGGGSTLGVNLVAVRPRTRVRVWLAAHYDSKGQPISMLTRIAAVMLATLGLVALAALGLAGLAGADTPRWWTVVAGAPAFAGGLLLLGNRATNTSPGAVDNASALTTVFAVLDRLSPEAPIGVLCPDAEEYGLLGARALVRERANLFGDAVVLNLDGIDDRGPTRCVVHRAGPFVDSVRTALAATGPRRLPVVVDGWEFARVARECATVMRGDWRTARIVHTPEDRADRLTLRGVEDVAGRLAGALEALGERP